MPVLLRIPAPVSCVRRPRVIAFALNRLAFHHRAVLDYHARSSARCHPAAGRRLNSTVLLSSCGPALWPKINEPRHGWATPSGAPRPAASITGCWQRETTTRLSLRTHRRRFISATSSSALPRVLNHAMLRSPRSRDAASSQLEGQELRSRTTLFASPMPTAPPRRRPRAPCCITACRCRCPRAAPGAPRHEGLPT